MLPEDPRGLDLDIALMTRGLLEEDAQHERVMQSLKPPGDGDTPPAVEVEDLIATMKNQVFRG